MKKNEPDLIPDGYLRVTTVLSPFVSFDHIRPDVLANAADRGTRVHKFCEAYTKARMLHAHNFVIDTADDDCKPYLSSFVAWYESVVDCVIYNELRLNCPKIKVSGQFDLLCRLKGDDSLVIIDFKTPQQSAISWQLQTAAYRYLLRSVKGEEATRRISLILDKEGGMPKVCEYTDHDKDEKLFLNALELYRFFHA